MTALAGSRTSTLALPMHPNVLLGGSERIMEGPFGAVTQNLLSLGSCPIEALARSQKADLEGFDLPFAHVESELLPGSSKPPPDPGSVVSDDKESQKVPSRSSMQSVAHLHQTCVGTFGNSEALKFEFLEETGREDNKQCILTITRPNGQTRSYASERIFSRKSDAKARSATIAIEMGAIDFILHGNKDSSSGRMKLLVPLDSTAVNKPETGVKEESSATGEVMDERSKGIETLCKEWRAGKVMPRWVFFQEHKASPLCGCVLAIELSPHCRRLFSVDSIYNSQSLARKACSEAAIEQGAIDFMKYGNGQKTPAPTTADSLDDSDLKREPDLNKDGRASAISLQSYFDSLPRPFPEPLDDKNFADLNFPGMLNTTLQLAKGARLTIQFFFLNINNLHGSVIRLNRPGETKTYMAECKFAKRSDAKAAVCLQAMSQGVTDYIRSLAIAVDKKITPEMRKLANEQILPILGTEYGKLRQGMHPAYDYGHDLGAFSCTMTLSLAADPKPGESKSWSVKPEYRTKIDAKIAVVCAAGAEAIEFVRFRGEPPPPDHDPFKPYRRRDIKRESSTEFSSGPPKHAASGMVRLGLSRTPLIETKEEAKTRLMAEGRWNHAEHSQQRPPRQPLRRPSHHHLNGRSHPDSDFGYERPARPLSYDNPTTTRDRRSGSPVEPPTFGPPYRSKRPPPQSSPRNVSQPEVEQLRPPRKSRLRMQSSNQSLTCNYHSLPDSPPRQRQQPKASPRQHSLDTYQGLQQPSPQSPSPQLQHSAAYGSLSQHQQPIPPPYPSGPYPPAFTPSPYSYPVQQGVPYPQPTNSYPFPVSTPTPGAPPTYGVPAYPAYAAYYADPRYTQYAQYAQYSVPAVPMPYAVPVLPAAGIQFPSPPPPPSAQPIDTMTSTSSNIPPSTPPLNGSNGSTDGPSGARGPKLTVTPTRTASFSTGNDRQKRPRSREMSMSPEDAQKPKKHRSESSLPHSSVKRESVSASPALPTPVSGSNKESASSVDQLLRYCESEGLSWPEFGSRQMKNDYGVDVFKVWIVMGKERLELPITFSSENEGRQRVAKQVLQRLRAKAAGK